MTRKPTYSSERTLTGRWHTRGKLRKPILAAVLLMSVAIGGAALTARSLAASGNTYYVTSGGSGSAACTQAAPCTFSRAYTVAASGDTVMIASGSYGSLSISGGTKAVKFVGAGTSTVLSGVSFGSTTGSSVESVRVNGEVSAVTSNTVAISNSTINNGIYFAGNNGVIFDHNMVEPATANQYWNNNDMMDIYPAGTGTPNNPNHDITISNSTFHGLRGQEVPGKAYQHPDTIQSYNNGAPHTGIKLLNNKFYDNECIDLRTNPKDEYTLENNVFGDSVYLNGCGDFAIDVGYANVTARYNTFTGGQEVQETPNVSGTHQTWIGNVGNGFSAGCGNGGASGATISHNVWTEQKCNSTDKQTSNLLLNSDGSLKSGSPALGAGDSSNYPTLDFLGNTRGLASTGAPDAGAIATNITTGGGGGGGGGATYHSADLNNLLSHYGLTSGQSTATGDLNGDGTVNAYDLGILLNDYSPN